VVESFSGSMVGVGAPIVRTLDGSTTNSQPPTKRGTSPLRVNPSFVQITRAEAVPWEGRQKLHLDPHNDDPKSL